MTGRWVTVNGAVIVAIPTGMTIPIIDVVSCFTRFLDVSLRLFGHEPIPLVFAEYTKKQVL